MKVEPIKVLAIEDSASDVVILREILQGGSPMQFCVTGAQRLDQGMAMLRESEFDVVLLDLGLPDSQGLDTLRKLRKKFGEIPIIVLTGLDDEATGMEAIQGGAQDYIVKGQMTGPGQARAIRYAIERKRSERTLRAAKDELAAANQELEGRVRQRTAELQERVAELEALSYSISHDLRAPLRAMKGYSETLLSEHPDQLNEEGRYCLTRISKAAERLDLLVQDVLTYTYASKSGIDLSPVDLNALIRDIIESFPALHAPGVSISIKEPLPPVLAHPAFISQVFSNLLTNAAKFTRPGVAPEISISSEMADGMVRVVVEDNGIGIDPSHFERIFQIFGRVHDDKLYDGTGIGLAIVKKAVERMGGATGVESRPGNGSRFWFTLRRPA
jgi:signal transduction histidine kinase